MQILENLLEKKLDSRNKIKYNRKTKIYINIKIKKFEDE